MAAQCGHETIVKMLVKYGADVNAADLQGCTPLQRAALNGHENVVGLLLKSKATPISHGTARYGHESVVKLLF